MQELNVHAGNACSDPSMTSFLISYLHARCWNDNASILTRFSWRLDVKLAFSWLSALSTSVVSVLSEVNVKSVANVVSVVNMLSVASVASVFFHFRRAATHA